MTRKTIALDSGVHKAISDSADKAGLTIPAYVASLVNNSIEAPPQSAVAPRFKPLCIWSYADYKAVERDAEGRVTKWDSDFSCPIRAAEPTMTTEKLLSKGCPLCLRFVKLKAKTTKQRQPRSNPRPQATYSNYPTRNASHDPGLSYDSMRGWSR
jgi:hypothetical protein